MRVHWFVEYDQYQMLNHLYLFTELFRKGFSSLLKTNTVGWFVVCIILIYRNSVLTKP